MAYQALYRAWRPDRFSDVVGQEPIITTLTHQILSGRVAHAYLFCGSRGTGKTSTAKVLARAINCQHPLEGAEPCGTCEACLSLARENSMDVMEIDAASNNGVDEIRALRDKIVYPPTVGKYKVYIIDEVHMLSTGAFNALLKTLEEPPAHAVFILATTEPQKLPATILSRCQRFDFKRIPARVIVKRLETVLEGIGRKADGAALEMIARSAEGGMRDALSLMDMCLSYEDGALTAQLVREVLGASDRAFLFDFAQALLDGRADAALTAIHQLVQDGRDPAVFLKEVVGHFRSLLLSQLVKAELADLLEVTEEDAGRYRAQAAGLPSEALMRRMELFMAAEADMKWASQPRAVLELSAVRACHPEREAGNDALAERLARLEKAVAEGVAPKAKKEKEMEKVKEKPPERPQAAPQADQAPAQGPEQELWKKALDIVSQQYKAVFPLVAQAVYLGLEGDVATLEIPKKWKMYYTVLESTGKKQLVEQALSQAAGSQVHLRVVLQGGQVSKPAAAKSNLTQVYEAFGRENVVVVDE